MPKGRKRNRGRQDEELEQIRTALQARPPILPSDRRGGVHQFPGVESANRAHDEIAKLKASVKQLETEFALFKAKYAELEEENRRLKQRVGGPRYL